MTPEQALEKQIERYRTMTCEERIGIALRLHELASEMARAGIRAQHPSAGKEEVERLLRERRQLANAA
jgi:Rv0078B-related antitoxin